MNTVVLLETHLIGGCFVVKFFIDARTSVPPQTQILEQVKFALFFGHLRPGDTLPSIRDLANQLSVGPGIVRATYSELIRAGILASARGKRIVVNPNLSYRRNGAVQKQTYKLAEEFFRKVVKLGIQPQSFAQFFQHWVKVSGTRDFVVFMECNRYQANQYAEEAERAWGIPVRGATFDELRASPTQWKDTQYLLTVPYHLDEAREIGQKHRKRVVTIDVEWESEIMDQIAKLSANSSVAFVFRKRDADSYGQLILREVEARFPRLNLNFSCMAIENIEDIHRLTDQTREGMVLFSNRLWDSLDESIKSHPGVSVLKLRTDSISLEKARTEIGLLA